MAPVNPPQYLQAGSYTARNDRLMVGSMMTPQTGTSALAIRSGVRPSPGNSGLAVRQRLTPAMSVTVAAGSAFIQSPSATGGCYVAVNDASHDVTVTTAHATLGRRDLIVARVYDAEVAGSSNLWALEVVTGTPSGSPIAPGVPSGAISLASVLVAANQTTIVNGNITDTRASTTALGGTVPAPASALPANPYVGMAAYDTTNLRPTWHNGTTWQSWSEDPVLRDGVITRCTSTTRPSSPVSGQRIWETDTGREMIYSGSAWIFYKGIDRSAVKPTDEIVTLSTTKQNDDDLFMSVEANAVYRVRAYLIYTAGTSGDFDMGWTVPTGAICNWMTSSLDQNVVDSTSGIISRYNLSVANTWHSAGVGVANVVAPAEGILQTSVTAGTFRLRWGQLNNEAVSTILRAGSALMLTRIA